MRWLRTWLKEFWYSRFGTVALKCGHRTKIAFTGRIGDYNVNGGFPVDWPINYCANCFLKLGIPCAFCGSPIILGSPITLYRLRPGCKPAHQDALCFDGDVYIGCLNPGCAHSPLAIAGFWVPDEDADPPAAQVALIGSELFVKLVKEGRLPGTIIETET